MKAKLKFNTQTKIASVLMLFFPLAAAAQGIIALITQIEGVLGVVITFFMVVATVIFLYGIITYLTAGGVEDKIKEGKTYMIWGIVALFVMIAVWGLVAVLGNTFPAIDTGAKIPKGPQQ